MLISPRLTKSSWTVSQLREATTYNGQLRPLAGAGLNSCRVAAGTVAVVKRGNQIAARTGDS